MGKALTPTLSRARERERFTSAMGFYSVRLLESGPEESTFVRIIGVEVFCPVDDEANGFPSARK